MGKLILLLLLPLNAHAAENWLCTTESSLLRGNQIYSCGIGTSSEEAHAREKALESAKREFSGLCKASTDCPGREVSIEPKRTTCSEDRGVWECHRLLVFTLGNKVPGVRNTEAAQAGINAYYSDALEADRAFWKEFRKHYYED